MNKKLYLLLLAAMLVALCLLVPSPALMEEWTPDLTQLTKIPLDAPSGYGPDDSCYTSEYSYEDPTISVQIETSRYCDTPMFIARVKIADASQLRTMMAGNYGTQRTALATTLAERGGAVLAINGDYFSYIGTGLVTRQGHTYRMRGDDDFDVLMVDVNGDFHVAKKIDEKTLEAAYAALGGSVDEGGNIVQAFTFGPALVENGVRAHEEYQRADGGARKKAQRMVIAQDGPLSYVIVCCEGPDNKNSEGLTLEEMGQFMLSLGVETAYNLDGGGSTTMVFRGGKINALTTSKNRAVSDIVYFCSGVAK